MVEVRLNFTNYYFLLLKRTKSESPADKARRWIIEQKDHHGLELLFINQTIGKLLLKLLINYNGYVLSVIIIFFIIGRGVFTTIPFNKDDFLVQYKGQILRGQEGEEREKNYSDEDGNFLFFFEDHGETCWYVCVQEGFNAPDHKLYFIQA